MRHLIWALLAFAVAVPASADLVWDFSEGAEGWRIADMNCGGTYATPRSYFNVTWAEEHGDPGGHIYSHDPSSYCFFFDAPAASLGNLSAYAGGTVEFSLKSTYNNWGTDNAVVLVGSNGVTLSGRIIPLPGTQWQRYSIWLIPGSFRRNGLNGPQATTADLDGVLASVAALRISAEFGAAVQETSALDSVGLYERRSALGIQNARTKDPIMAEATKRYPFRVWGRITVINQDSFELEDGSGAPVLVQAPDHNMQDGAFGTANGNLNLTGAQPTLDTTYGSTTTLAP